MAKYTYISASERGKRLRITPANFANIVRKAQKSKRYYDTHYIYLWQSLSTKEWNFLSICGEWRRIVGGIIKGTIQQ